MKFAELIKEAFKYKAVRVIFYGILIGGVLWAGLTKAKRISTWKKQEKELAIKDKAIKEARAAIVQYQIRRTEDSVKIASYEYMINSLYTIVNQLKKEAKGYEHLVKKKPSDPAVIISLDSAEIFLAKRYGQLSK